MGAGIFPKLSENLSEQQIYWKFLNLNKIDESEAFFSSQQTKQESDKTHQISRHTLAAEMAVPLLAACPRLCAQKKAI